MIGGSPQRIIRTDPNSTDPMITALSTTGESAGALKCLQVFNTPMASAARPVVKKKTTITRVNSTASWSLPGSSAKP